MSDSWYRDPDKPRDGREGGRRHHHTREDPPESSTGRGEASSNRRETPTHRPRRTSVISSGSNNGSYRHDERHYHPRGGYNPQQEYGSSGGDPVGNLVGNMQTLSIRDSYYTNVPATATQATRLGNTEPTGTPRQGSEIVDYGQTNTLSPTLPRQHKVPLSRQIKGTPGDRETLDKSYKVRNRDYKEFFRRGRVFSTLWTEGVGNSKDNNDGTFISEVRYKERVHTKIRRFVVVRVGDRSVSCLPVTSYDGAGHKKHGIRLEDHGFMHSRNSAKRVDGMLSKSLKVLLSNGAGHFKDPSLVNYGKVYAVETNVKVKDIGELDADSRSVLLRYWQRVFFEEADLPASEISDMPRQSEALLSYVGGASYDNVAASGYNVTPTTSSYAPASSSTPAASQDPSRNPLPLPTSGYQTSQYTELHRYDGSVYQNQTSAGSLYPAANAAPYTSPPGYTVSRSADLNTSPSYNASDIQYSTSATSSASTGTYGPNYLATSTPRTYPAEQTTTLDYPPSSVGQVSSSGDSPYPTNADGEIDGEITLPTVADERRRRERNTGNLRRERRHHH